MMHNYNGRVVFVPIQGVNDANDALRQCMMYDQQGYNSNQFNVQPGQQQGSIPSGIPGNQQGTGPFGMPGQQQRFDPFEMPGNQQGSVPSGIPGQQQRFDPFGMHGQQQGSVPSGIPRQQQGSVPSGMPGQQQGPGLFGMPGQQQRFDPFGMHGNQQGSVPSGMPGQQQRFDPFGMHGQQQGSIPSGIPGNQQGPGPFRMPGQQNRYYNRQTNINPACRNTTEINKSNIKLFLETAKNSGVLIIPENISKIYPSRLVDANYIVEVIFETSNFDIIQPLNGVGIFRNCDNIQRIHVENIESCQKIFSCMDEYLRKKVIEQKMNFYKNGNKIELREIDPELDYDTATEINEYNDSLFLKTVEGGVLTIPKNIGKINDACLEHAKNIHEVRFDTNDLEIMNKSMFFGCDNIKKICVMNLELCRKIFNNLCLDLKAEVAGQRLNFYENGKKVELRDINSELDCNTATEVNFYNTYLFLKTVDDNGVLTIPKNINKISSFSIRGDHINEINFKTNDFDMVEVEDFENLGLFGTCDNLKKIRTNNIELCRKIFNCMMRWMSKEQVIRQEINFYVNGRKVELRELDPNLDYNTVKEINSGNVILFLKSTKGREHMLLTVPKNIEKIDVSCLISYADCINEIKFENSKFEILYYILSECTNVEKIHANDIEFCKEIFNRIRFGGRLPTRGFDIDIKFFDLYVNGRKVEVEEVDPELNFNTATTINTLNAKLFIETVEKGVLTIPKNIKAIEADAFSNLNNIKEVKIETSNFTIVTKNYIDCFKGCNNLRKIYANDTESCRKIIHHMDLPLRETLLLENKLHCYVNGKEVGIEEIDPNLNCKTATEVSFTNARFFSKTAKNGVLTIPEKVNKINCNFFGCIDNSIHEVRIEASDFEMTGDSPGSCSFGRNIERIYTKNIESCREIFYYLYQEVKERFILNNELHFYIDGEKITPGDIDPNLVYETATEINSVNKCLFFREAWDSGILIIPANIKKIHDSCLANLYRIKEVKFENDDFEAIENIYRGPRENKFIFFKYCSEVEKIHVKNTELCRKIFRNIESKLLKSELERGRANFYVDGKEVEMVEVYEEINEDNESMFLKKAEKNNGVLIIPENIQKIYYDTFKGAKDIKAIKFEGSVPEIGYKVLSNFSNLESIYTKDIEICRYLCENYREIDNLVVKGKLHFYVDDKEVETIYLFKNIEDYNKSWFLKKAKENDGVLIIPENIEKIDDFVFTNKKGIRTIKFEGRTSEGIGHNIFYGSLNIKEIYTKDIETCIKLYRNDEMIEKLALENKLHFYVNDEEFDISKLNH